MEINAAYMFGYGAVAVLVLLLLRLRYLERTNQRQVDRLTSEVHEAGQRAKKEKIINEQVSDDLTEALESKRKLEAQLAERERHEHVEELMGEPLRLYVCSCLHCSWVWYESWPMRSLDHLTKFEIGHRERERFCPSCKAASDIAAQSRQCVGHMDEAFSSIIWADLPG